MSKPRTLTFTRWPGLRRETLCVWLGEPEVGLCVGHVEYCRHQRAWVFTAIHIVAWTDAMLGQIQRRLRALSRRTK